ncbi:unnamed protein product [Chrysodeixis includens]|uniref:Uncharacterized protein n=1 Tax=Chrysodeixis includens TaxID=689277 RepID=A0A9N8Q297_CHRIL|nr:unnamed protein product [Chrysodeixis includens]
MVGHDVVGAVLQGGVEAGVVIAMVVHVSDGAVGLVQGVAALHDVTVAVLVLRLDVTSVRVLDLIPELVLGVSVVIMMVVSVSMMHGLMVAVMAVDVLRGVPVSGDGGDGQG